MSEKLKEVFCEKTEPELEVTIVEKRIRELELKQQAYQKEVEEKFNRIFQWEGTNEEE